MHRQMLMLGALTAALWCGAQPHAQIPAGTSTERAAKPSEGAKITSGERKFLEKVARHNMAEVETGFIAASKGSHPDVKKFGERMARDHGKSNEELAQLAQAKGVQLPAAPERGHQRKAGRLQRLAGAEFDRKYMREMVDDHEKNVKEFRKMAKSAKDPDVKAWTQKTLPVLEAHLTLARKVSDTAGAVRAPRKS